MVATRCEGGACPTGRGAVEVVAVVVVAVTDVGLTSSDATFAANQPRALVRPEIEGDVSGWYAKRTDGKTLERGLQGRHDLSVGCARLHDVEDLLQNSLQVVVQLLNGEGEEGHDEMSTTIERGCNRSNCVLVEY